MNSQPIFRDFAAILSNASEYRIIFFNAKYGTCIIIRPCPYRVNFLKAETNLANEKVQNKTTLTKTNLKQSR